MQKIKFQIKGMHCHSCASLIESKLKEHPGIIKVKVNEDLEKAVVVYDEQKIQEADIHQLVREAGDYEAVKISEDDYRAPVLTKKPIIPSSSKASFLMGFLISFSILSLSLNIILINRLISPAQGQIALNSNTNTQVQNAPSVADPTGNQPSQPTNQAPAIQTFTITKDNHVRGDFNAPITLVEFSDFECPYCENHYPTLNKILSDYQGQVRLVYKHFPLSFHPNSEKAAEASECADEQGKFWGYHDKLFDNQPSGLSTDKFKQWAKDLGLNSQQFDNCLDTGKYAQKVQADYQEGVTKGVNGTPATFVNGILVSGALPYEQFKSAIDQLLP